MKEVTWLQRYRAQFSWGRSIRRAKVRGIPCCWVHCEGERHYDVPGNLRDIAKACADAAVVANSTRCSATVLFLDRKATAAQVEEALFTTSRAGLGCGFLRVQPRLLQYRLLNRVSEGNLVQDLFAAVGWPVKIVAG